MVTHALREARENARSIDWGAVSRRLGRRRRAAAGPTRLSKTPVDTRCWRLPLICLNWRRYFAKVGSMWGLTLDHCTLRRPSERPVSDYTAQQELKIADRTAPDTSPCRPTIRLEGPVNVARRPIRPCARSSARAYLNLAGSNLKATRLLRDSKKGSEETTN